MRSKTSRRIIREMIKTNKATKAKLRCMRICTESKCYNSTSTTATSSVQGYYSQWVRNEWFDGSTSLLVVL